MLKAKYKTKVVYVIFHNHETGITLVSYDKRRVSKFKVQITELKGFELEEN